MIDRTLGENFTVSVGTALALEEHFLKDGALPKAIWFNVKTLFTNFWGGWSNDERPTVHTMFDAFVDEMETIRSLCLNEEVQCIFYLPSYQSLNIKFKYASLVSTRPEDIPERKAAYVTAERVMMNVVKSRFEDLVRTDVALPSNGQQAWIFSSFPVDLLSWSSFSSLKLLERHTGKLKDKREWFGKLNKREDISHFPFNTFTLQVFGDKSVLLRGQGIKLKNAVIKLGLEKGWNNTTTLTRIRENLSNMEKGELRDQLILLARTI